MRVAAERSGNSPFGGGALHGWLQILVEQRGKPAATLWRWSSTKVVGDHTDRHPNLRIEDQGIPHLASAMNLLRCHCRRGEYGQSANPVPL